MVTCVIYIHLLCTQFQTYMKFISLYCNYTLNTVDIKCGGQLK